MFISVLLFFSVVLIQKGQNLIDLRTFEYKSRLVCIESSKKSNALRQLSVFKHLEKENADRKLEFFVKIEDRYFRGLDLQPVYFLKNFPKVKDKTDFAVILIGLDGGIKNQWYFQVKSQEIYQTIDAMPMRLGEIRDR